jgi:hypothetical protein
MNGRAYATLVRTLARSHVPSPRSFSAEPFAFKVIQGPCRYKAGTKTSPARS